MGIGLRGGFRHVQHVRPNRGPNKKGAPTGQRLSDASTTFSDLGVGPIYTVLRHLKLKSSRGAELHSFVCGLWVGGSVCRIAKSEIMCQKPRNLTRIVDTDTKIS